MVAAALAFAVVVVVVAAAVAAAAAALAAGAIVVLVQGIDAGLVVIDAVTGIAAVVGFSLNFPRSQPFRIVFAICLGGTVSTTKQGLKAGTIYGFTV